MENPKFELYKSSANSQYYFRLKAVNGKITLSSEGYIAKQSCKDGIASVKQNAPDEQRFERRQNNGSYTFVLKARNGEIIGRSQSYTSPASRDTGIDSVKEDAPNATVDDLC
ncbi:YegP family protein [Chitinophaga filiformis]|uniref:DUF1508 domain-containing protein n=1 Tax=Chitinophaga filiformis TaxID=104663 RepID=A0A1G7X1G5_CHIFI|nr:YegP family protein [Chitinophaga filiformis]SDG78044.1 hypothetical protein SAMN04488121_106261 [Chitinophaga filiformis]